MNEHRQESTATAAQMAKTFPYILTSGLLDSAVCADTGLTALPAISATSEEDTNLCTLSVTGRSHSRSRTNSRRSRRSHSRTVRGRGRCRH